MSEVKQRNPGPSWGFACLRWMNHHLPPPVLHCLGNIGSAVAWARMPAQRQASREYLTEILGRPADIRDSLKHFAAFTHLMLAKIDAGDGAPVTFAWEGPEDEAVGARLFSDEQLLLGTFHVGGSEFLGFHGLSELRRIALVRQARDNAGDIEQLLQRMAGKLRIVWTQSGESVIFAIRDLIAEGYSLAMQCDRAEDASKFEIFQFLGGSRAMPVTIYRLSHLYSLPVCFCVALPTERARHFQIKAFPVYQPQPGSRSQTQEAAHAHFQGVLDWLEGILRAHPEQWFNFQSLGETPSLKE